MSGIKKAKVHLFSGFLGTGKTTTLRHLMQTKNPQEKWVIVVNEFGEIGIDGAVLSDNGIPVAEVSGGCLCCVAGTQMGSTINRMISGNHPDRIIIEASGLAHAASVIDELRTPPFDQMLDIGAVFTLIDPRQFLDDDYALQPLYRDQISVADVLVANKTDLCSEAVLVEFQRRAAQLFPPKSEVVLTREGRLDAALLDVPVVGKSRYRIQTLPENSLGFQSQGYAFDVEKNFDGQRLTEFFDALPNLCEGLVRAKGVFRVLDTWVWLNWSDGTWGAKQVAWRRDSRFELIARSFDAQAIEVRLNAALENKIEAAARGA